VTNHQHQAALQRFAYESTRVRQIGSERLFDENMLSRSQRLHGNRSMVSRGRGDYDRIDSRERGLQACCVLYSRIRSRNSLSSLLVLVNDDDFRNIAKRV
jgi:hypothetical protein